MDFRKSLHLSRLRRAHEQSYEGLKYARRFRRSCVEQMAAACSGEHNMTRKAVPINLLGLWHQITRRDLVSGVPRALVTTKTKELKPYAADQSADLDVLMQEIDLVHTLRGAVSDALIVMAIVKVGLAESDRLDRLGNEPFAELVDIDDWVHDLGARKWSQPGFMADREWVSMHDLRYSGDYIKKAVDQLSPMLQSEEQDAEERTSAALVDESQISEPYLDRVAVWNYFLPEDNIILTVPNDHPDIVLARKEWAGPRKGPYHRLMFMQAPGSTAPMSVMASLIDIHSLANAVVRKLGRQARNQKTVVGVRAAARADGERVIHADDGQMIPVDHRDAFSPLNFGGPNQGNMAFAVMLRDLFSYVGGGMDTRGGLSAASDTVGQEKIIADNATGIVADMREQTIEFTRKVVSDLAWWRWNYSLHNRQVERPIDSEYSVTSSVGPEHRKGAWFNYQFDIHPYSLQSKTPSQKLQTITALLDRISMLRAEMQQQGLTIDVREVVNLCAKLADEDELCSLVRYTEQAGGQRLSDDKTPTQNTSHRIYEQVRRPSRTRQASDFALIQSLSGKGVQDSEIAAMARGQ